MREYWPWAANVTIGPLKRTDKGSCLEIKIFHVQNTQIRCCLNKSCKTVLRSKTILKSLIIQRTLGYFLICIETTHFLRTVASLHPSLLLPHFSYLWATLENSIVSIWDNMNVRILGIRRPEKPSLIVPVFSGCAYKTWRVCKFWSQDTILGMTTWSRGSFSTRFWT